VRALKELKLMDLHLVRELSVPSLEKLELIKMPKPGKVQWADGSSIFTFTRRAGGVSI